MANLAADSRNTSTALCHINVTIINTLAGFLSVVLLLVLAPPARADGAIYFGIQGAAAKTTLEAIWQPLLADMAKEIGRPVEARLFDDYAGTVAAMRKGEVHLAWMGNKNAIEAVDTADAEIFAQVLNSRGVPGYYSLLITRSDHPFQDADDVFANKKNIVFGFGDRHSTSGTTVPLYFLFAKNNRSHHELGEFRHTNHEANFLAVANGSIDVATISSVMLQRFKERYPKLAEKVRIIWASPIIPTDPLIWHRTLDPELKSMIRDFFLSYGRPVAGKSRRQLAMEQERLSRTKWSGFKISSNKQLEYVRILYLFGELEAVKADQDLAPETRDRRIAELETRIRKMESGQR